jgi:hypothetical protein
MAQDDHGRPTVQLIDILANRPPASTVARGASFYATDTTTMYVANGSAWVPVGAGRSGGSFIGTYAARPSPAASVAGDIYQCTDGYTFQFDGTVWRPVIESVLGKQPPPAAQFTASGDATTLQDDSGTLLFVLAGGAGLGTPGVQTLENGVNGCTQPTGNSAELYAVFENGFTSLSGGPTAFNSVGVRIQNPAGDSAGIRLVQVCQTHESGCYLFVEGTGGVAQNEWNLNFQGPVFTRVRTDGVNVFWEFSRNPNAPVNPWGLLFTAAFGVVFPGGAPTKSGLYLQMDAFGTSDIRAWVRHFATS